MYESIFFALFCLVLIFVLFCSCCFVLVVLFCFVLFCFVLFCFVLFCFVLVVLLGFFFLYFVCFMHFAF